MFFQVERLFSVFLVFVCSIMAFKLGNYEIFAMEGKTTVLSAIGNFVAAPYQFCFIAFGPAFVFFLISDRLKYGGWGHEVTGYSGLSFATISDYARIYFSPKCPECGASISPGMNNCPSCGECLKEELCSF